MEESLLYIQRIKAIYGTKVFSKSDIMIADYILANPNCVFSATANSLAEATNSSPATVVRFCRKLGFSGLSDMKSSQRILSGTEEDIDLKRGDGVGTVKTKVINYTKMIMDRLEDTLDDGALEEAARLISNANHVVIIGEGGSGTICRAAYDIFLKLAIPCHYVEDMIFQMMEISMMDENDVLFIIVNSGRTINVLQNAQYAKERGLRTIGIVGPVNSPLAKYLDIEIPTSLFSSEFFSDISAARTCELTTISILHSLIAITRDEEQLKKSGEISRSIERKRLPPK